MQNPPVATNTWISHDQAYLSHLSSASTLLSTRNIVKYIDKTYVFHLLVTIILSRDVSVAVSFPGGKRAMQYALSARALARFPDLAKEDRLISRGKKAKRPPFLSPSTRPAGYPWRRDDSVFQSLTSKSLSSIGDRNRSQIGGGKDAGSDRSRYADRTRHRPTVRGREGKRGNGKIGIETERVIARSAPWAIDQRRRGTDNMPS